MFKIKIPATSANIGSGFDSVGLSLNIYNEIIIKENEKSKKIDFEIFGEGKDELPKNKTNMVYSSMEYIFNMVKKRPKNGCIITCKNAIPLSKGLGSSSAAVIGGLIAGNLLTDEKLSIKDILNIAVNIEGHPDNVAPAILGGIVSGAINKELVYIKIKPPKNLKAIVAIPDFILPTKKAREILPKKVLREDAIFNISRAALLTAAFISNKLDILRTATEDRLHQNYRAHLIPGLLEVFDCAKRNGALSVTISGAGSSVLSLANSNIDDIKEAMFKTFKKYKVNVKIEVLNIPFNGVKIIKNK